MLLTDLADACRESGLTVVELPGWESNVSGGSFDPEGVLCHHTGSYDALTDARNDHEYAEWLAFTGRPDLPAPLCNLALSAEGVVYVCSSGNANHAGRVQASGPMPAASDGNALYVGIEAMNSGSQGWAPKQYDAYVRLCAALCRHYGWPASHVRAHKETSVTGKWDPGRLGMSTFRRNIARTIEETTMLNPRDIFRYRLYGKKGGNRTFADLQRQDSANLEKLVKDVEAIKDDVAALRSAEGK